ncbi:hypothetical protein D3C75_1380060 [compost metagenome]
MFISARFGEMSAGASSGKKETTLSSSDNRCSETAKPIAVDVKLLLSEKSVWGSSGL